MPFINLHLTAQKDSDAALTSILTVEDQRGRKLYSHRLISQDMHYERLMEAVQNGLRTGLNQLFKDETKQGENT